MRDPRSLFLLVVALLFITVSFVLISIWGYHFYYLNQQGTADVQVDQKKPRAGNSFQNIYDAPPAGWVLAETLFLKTIHQPKSLMKKLLNTIFSKVKLPIW